MWRARHISRDLWWAGKERLLAGGMVHYKRCATCETWRWLGALGQTRHGAQLRIITSMLLAAKTQNPCSDSRGGARGRSRRSERRAACRWSAGRAWKEGRNMELPQDNCSQEHLPSLLAFSWFLPRFPRQQNISTMEGKTHGNRTSIIVGCGFFECGRWFVD